MTAADDAPITVLFVEDHEAIRKAIGLLLRSEGFEVVGATADPREALALARRRRPAVALVDVKLGDQLGTDLVAAMRAEGLSTEVVLYTGAEDSETLRAALDAGASGVACKASAPSVLLEAIRTVAGGEPFFDPRLDNLLNVREDGPEPLLTPREREILALLAGGLDGEEIAERLVVSPLTVRTHIRNAMNRLAARTRPHAVAIALERREI
jgi:DNA-binding NarL/FixJ family response regulator